MTTPPFEPAPTEPVPAIQPPAQPPAQPVFQPAFAPPEPGPVAPAPVAAPKGTSGGSSRVLTLALAVAVLVAAAGVAFAVGRATAPAASTGGTTATVGQNGQNGTGNRGNGFPNASFDPNGLPGGGRSGGFAGRTGLGGFGGGLTITGTVESVAADSITIKLPSGQTVTVGLDGTTTYHQQAPASASDVTAGKTVQLQLSGGFRGQIGNNGATGGSSTLGTAGSVTIIP